MVVHNPERYYTSTTNITTVPVSRQYPEEKALPCLGILVGIEASPTNGGSTEITPPPAPSNPFEHHGNKGRPPAFRFERASRQTARSGHEFSTERRSLAADW